MKKTAPDPMDLDKDLMDSMLNQFSAPERCRRGEIVRGVIASVTPKAILIDIGGKSDALVVAREVEQMSPKELQSFKPGQSVHVYVVETGEESDSIVVSLARAIQETEWNQALSLMQQGTMVNLPVVEANKGGVIVSLGRLRGFVPSSQLLSNWRSFQNSVDPERRWDGLVGKTLNLRVIEVTQERNRLILSERAGVDQKARKRMVLEELEIGHTYPGVVSNLVLFGAFVNVKGVDGLVHISEISWKRINHPNEVLNVGDEVQVRVLDVNLEQERLSLSLKQQTPDPWEIVGNNYKEGQLLEVQVIRMTTFGAFASPLDLPEVEGLIHVSELRDQPVLRPDEVVKVGDRIVVRIISLRPAERRIAFSLKRVVDGESPETENWRENLDQSQLEAFTSES